MVIYTQTICRQKPTNCLIVFDHFVGLALKALAVAVAFLVELLQYNLLNNVGCGKVKLIP